MEALVVFGAMFSMTWLCKVVPRLAGGTAEVEAAQAEVLADAARAQSLEQPDTLVEWAKLNRQLNKKRAALRELETASASTAASARRLVMGAHAVVALIMIYLYSDRCILGDGVGVGALPAADTAAECWVGGRGWVLVSVLTSRWLLGLVWP
eukprot:c7625_g1_i1.p1 GENE.c7625_g1_i1~~c7625_g1_i1.p1  ORF type:complete len:152 (-),score=23.84 c7625_g1_i1:35-490(-)